VCTNNTTRQMLKQLVELHKARTTGGKFRAQQIPAFFKVQVYTHEDGPPTVAHDLLRVKPFADSDAPPRREVRNTTRVCVPQSCRLCACGHTHAHTYAHTRAHTHTHAQGHGVFAERSSGSRLRRRVRQLRVRPPSRRQLQRETSNSTQQGPQRDREIVCVRDGCSASGRQGTRGPSSHLFARSVC
jgi:hypothetical protein